MSFYELIDKTSKTPIDKQIVSKIIDLVDKGQLNEENSLLPDYREFAREIAVSPRIACRIYNCLQTEGYGHYNDDRTFTLNCKERAKIMLQESVAYALKCGLSLDEIVEIVERRTNET